MKKVIKKKMSFEDLTASMNRGFKRVENLIEKKIDRLAISSAKGFQATATKDDLKDLEFRMNGKFEGVNKRIDDLATTRVKPEDHNTLKVRVDKIEAKLK